VIIIKDKFWGPFLERFSGRDELEEMATLKKDMTGLPVNIWVDDSGAYIRGRHAKRIKFQGDYGNKTNAGNLFSMVLSKSDPQIPSNQLSKLRLPSKDIDMIKIFVKKNADILDKLADEKINIGVFLQQMKK
jgi:hypothetical protein